MSTITRTWTETCTARIDLPIDSEYALTRALTSLGSHYMDADTRRYFGSRISHIWPTADGAIWTETTNGPRRGMQRWTYAKQLIIHTQEQIDAGEPTHSIETLYQDQGEASPRIAAARAHRAAEQAAKGDA